MSAPTITITGGKDAFGFYTAVMYRGAKIRVFRDRWVSVQEERAARFAREMGRRIGAKVKSDPSTSLTQAFFAAY